MADVKFDETWPFRIRIMDGEREGVAFERYLMSTDWKTLDDVREARDWDGMTGAATAEDARELIARQERDAHLIAASPDLYEALKDLRACIMETRGPCSHVAVLAADAALKKAEGRS